MRQSNKKIAITGGIGSGKSIVSKIIETAGFPVFSCDETYSELIKDKKFLQELSGIFGDILNENGELDKGKLSNIVFNDKSALEKLNSFTHPKVFERMFEKAKSFNSTCFFEVPLLFEGGYQDKFDQVIVVQRDLNERVESVVKRSNLTREQVFERINAQYNYDMGDFTKYYVIHNINDFEYLKAETLAVLKKII
jgi:dephospho-CoA kinase